MKQCNLTFKISLISMLAINVVCVVFFLVALILSFLKVSVFGVVHFWIGVVVVVLNVLYLIYLTITLLINNKKINVE